jgi:hypothetical protein
MRPNDVLIDLLEDNRRRLKRAFDVMGDQCVYWNPDMETNNIAVTVWHMARIFDVFLTQQAIGDPAERECWFRNGWAEKTGYDPRGLGQNGWGMVAGYSYEEMRAIPHLGRAQLLGYLDEVYDSVKVFLTNTEVDGLFQPGAGFEGKYTKYQCIQMALMDNVRHLGEIFALKARWDRMEAR